MQPNLTIPPKRFALPLFFILTFLLAWGLWIPSSLANAGQSSFPLPEVLAGVLGAWAPSLVGILLTAAYHGQSGLATLGSRLLKWRCHGLLYLAAIGLPVIISLLTTGVAILMGAAAPDFTQPPITQTDLLPPELQQAGFLALLPTMLISQIIGSSLGEELGWRGFALPRLQIRYASLPASLILGLFWGLWHFPRLWVPGQTFDSAGFIWLVLGLMLNSILYTWLFNASQGSLIPVLILHTSQALTTQFLSVAKAPVVEFAVTLAIVALVAWKGLAANPARREVSPHARSA